jgi:predicted  nucleic acid-binding Zn-ribbon protein
MDKDTYIKQLEEENTALKKSITMLEKRIEELEQFLGMNSKIQEILERIHRLKPVPIGYG